ncbi:MAG: large conductance mechanosensitive channel [Frankiaceae bacterium]|jgi:large conductance mechanosensitive channel|nr:large conductance mechanosensitive channel [Frankiaceae bacterium]
MSDDSERDATERIEKFLRHSRAKLGIGGFRKFILRGNVIDLATGVVIGAAFTGLVNALVADFLTPLINIPLKKGTDFAQRYWEIGGSKFRYGDVLNKVLTLILIGLALYYFVVIPVNSLMDRFKPETEPGKQTKVCPECKSSIPYDATRCAFCTVEQPPLAQSEINT